MKIFKNIENIYSKYIQFMTKINKPKRIIEIEIHEYDDGYGYLAFTKGYEYKNLIVEANTLGKCLKELEISIKVIDDYKKNNITNN